MEDYKWMPINRMSREDKIKRHAWWVGGLMGCIDYWRRQMAEPEQYGVFNDWEQCDAQGSGLADLMDDMIELACEVDPECVPILQNMKESIANLRIMNYKMMEKLHDTPDPPMPTPEEEADAEAEKAEAFRTGGANLLARGPAQDGTGVNP